MKRLTHTNMATERSQMLGPCPMCVKNGKPSLVRRFLMNFSESISLCEDPRCIYPLGCFPIAKILTEASLQKPRAKTRRRVRASVEDIQTLGSPIKQARACGDFSEQNLSKDIPPSKKRINRSPSVDISKTGEVRGEPGSSSEESDGCPSRTRGIDEHSEGSHGGRLDLEIPSHLREHSYSRPRTENERPGDQDIAQPPWTHGMQWVLQWQNKYALCWLDCILMVLVNSGSVRQRFLRQSRICGREDSVGISQECFVRTLLTQYNQAQAMLATTLHGGGLPEGRRAGDGATPSAESLAAGAAVLNGARMAAFGAMRPRLKCELGKIESPAFALPLLLRESRELEELFLQSFSWETHCHVCLKESRSKDSSCLLTFPSVAPDWHPLNATHLGTCSHCQAGGQLRRLHWQRLAPVTAMHFETGTAHGDVDKYSFTHGGDAYAVSALIQQRTHPDHFIAWVRSQHGTWLECDDLSGPLCAERKDVSVPPHQLRVVFWERVASTAAEPRDSRQDRVGCGGQTEKADERADCPPDAEDPDVPDRRGEAERRVGCRGKRRVRFADSPTVMPETSRARPPGLTTVPGTRPDPRWRSAGEGVQSASDCSVPPRHANEQMCVDRAVGRNSAGTSARSFIDGRSFPGEPERDDDVRTAIGAGNAADKTSALSPCKPAARKVTDELVGRRAQRTSPLRRCAASTATLPPQLPRDVKENDLRAQFLAGKDSVVRFDGYQLRDSALAPITDASAKVDACPELASERGAPDKRGVVAEEWRRPGGGGGDGVNCGERDGSAPTPMEACGELHSLLRRLGKRRKELASANKFNTECLSLENGGFIDAGRKNGGSGSSPPQQISVVREELVISETSENVQTEHRVRPATGGALTEQLRHEEERDLSNAECSAASDKSESPHRFHVEHVSPEGRDGNAGRGHTCDIKRPSTESSDDELGGFYLTIVDNSSAELVIENLGGSRVLLVMESSKQGADKEFAGSCQTLEGTVTGIGTDNSLSEDHPAVAGRDCADGSDGNLEDRRAFNLTQPSTRGHHDPLQEYLRTLVEHLRTNDPDRELEGFSSCDITRASAEDAQEVLQRHHVTDKDHVSVGNLDQTSEARISHNVISLQPQDRPNVCLLPDTSTNRIGQTSQRREHDSQIATRETGTPPGDRNETRSSEQPAALAMTAADGGGGASEALQSDAGRSSDSESASHGPRVLGAESGERDNEPGGSPTASAGGHAPKPNAASGPREGRTSRAHAPPGCLAAAAPLLQRFRKNAVRLQVLAGDDSATFGGHRPKERAPAPPEGPPDPGAAAAAGSGGGVAPETGERGWRGESSAAEPEDAGSNAARPRADNDELKALLKRLKRRKQQLAMVGHDHK